MERAVHRVSCKAALFTPDGSKVLLVEYFHNKYGLPGGHMEAGEEPLETIQRELHEELGISEVHALKPRHFWRYGPEGKVVLEYVGWIAEDTTLTLDSKEIKSVRWASVRDIKDGSVSAGRYDSFILGAAEESSFRN